MVQHLPGRHQAHSLLHRRKIPQAQSRPPLELRYVLSYIYNILAIDYALVHLVFRLSWKSPCFILRLEIILWAVQAPICLLIPYLMDLSPRMPFHQSVPCVHFSDKHLLDVVHPDTDPSAEDFGAGWAAFKPSVGPTLHGGREWSRRLSIYT
jgi:hypothetical protein